MTHYVVDGIRILADHRPPALPGAGLPLLLVHGAGMDRTVWEAQSTALSAAGIEVLAVDLPGHGGSEGEALTSIAAMAEFLGRLLEVAGIETAAVAGHSMGALAVLELAARRPELIGGLVLVGAAASMPVHPGLLTATLDDLPNAASMIAHWGFPSAEAVGEGPIPGLWFAEVCRTMLAGGRPGVLHADLSACDSYRDGEASAARVGCPAVVAAGDADRMCLLAAAEALAAALPQGRCVVLERAGHMLPAERPEALSAILAEAARGG